MGQTYRDPNTGKLVYYPTNALTDDIYNQYLAYRNSYDPKTGGPDTYTNMSQKTGIDSGLLRDAVERYQTAQLNGEVADPYGLNAMSSQNYNSLANEPNGTPSWAQYDPHGNPISGAAATPSVSPVVSQGRGVLPDSNSITSQYANTRPPVTSVRREGGMRGTAPVTGSTSQYGGIRPEAAIPRTMSAPSVGPIPQASGQNALATMALKQQASGLQSNNYPNTMVPLGSNSNSAMTSLIGNAQPNRQVSIARTPGTNVSQMTNVAANPVYPSTTNTGSVPTLGANGQTGYDPQAWSSTNTSNPFINSSGGFTYDALPGMYNYLMQYLSQNANLSSGVNNALTSYLGQNLTGDYPQQMSEYLQQLIGNMGSGQMQFGTGQQSNAANMLGALSGGTGTSTPIQQQVQNTLSQLIGGSGLSPEYVAAAQESILKPALENTYGTANNMAGGVGELSSGLAQELARRTQSEFTNQLVQTGYNNLSNLLNQGNTAGATSFNQGLNLANLTGDQAQNALNNTFNSMSQGQNLMGTLLNSLLGLQGNAQNYTTALTGQYGNMAQNLLNNKTQKEISDNALSANKASNIGNTLGSILSSLLGGNKNGTNTGSNSGSGTNVQLPTSIQDILKTIFGGSPNFGNPAPLNDPNQPDTSGIDPTFPDISQIPLGDVNPPDNVNANVYDTYDQWLINQILSSDNANLGNYVWNNIQNPDTSFNSNWIDPTISDMFSQTPTNYADGTGYDYPYISDWIDYGNTDMISQQPSTYQYYDMMNPYSDYYSWLFQ